MKAALDSHWKELEQDLDSAVHQCEAQATSTIQEQNSCVLPLLKRQRPTTLLQSERQKIITLLKSMPFNSHTERAFWISTLEKEEHTHLLFLEAWWAALRACPIEAHEVLLYPLQFLMGNIPLASLLTATPQLAPPVREPPLTVPLPWHVNCHPLPQELNGSTTHPGRSYWTSCSCWRAYLSEAERGEAPHGAQRKLPRGLLSGHWPSSGHQADVFWGALPCFWPGGIPQSLKSFWGDDNLCQPLRVWDLWSPRGLGWTERPQVHPSCNEGFAQGSLAFPACVPFRVANGHGTKRDSSSQYTLLPCRNIVLPLVQERRAEWGESLIICRQHTAD